MGSQPGDLLQNCELQCCLRAQERTKCQCLGVQVKHLYEADYYEICEQQKSNDSQRGWVVFFFVCLFVFCKMRYQNGIGDIVRDVCQMERSDIGKENL